MRGALLVIATGVVLAGCRIGFDAVLTDDAGLGDGSLPRDATPQPVDCTNTVATFTVTTAIDEADAGETTTPPHEGAGLSLREAITIANATAGRECIVFASAMAVEIGAGRLPSLTGNDGVVIDGASVTSLTGTVVGFDLAAPNNELVGLSLSGFDVGIDTNGDGSRIADVRVVGGRIGLQVGGTGTQLHRVDVSSCSSQGLQIKDGSADTSIVLSVFHDNAGQGLKVGAGSNTVIRHTTFHNNTTDAVKVEPGATLVTIENSIFTNNGSAVRAQDAGSVSTVDHVQRFANLDDTCVNCSYGPNSLIADPKFVDPVSGDFRLAANSPAIDRGVDRGVDTNGSASGLFNGAAPDLGAFEAP